MTDNAADMIFFSVQDLFGYWKAHATMSGIQRVQAGIALYAIDNEGDRVGFILNDRVSGHVPGQFLLIDSDTLREIIVYGSGEKVDAHVLREMVIGCETVARRVSPVRGQAIILLGSFWGYDNTMEQYLASARAGVRIGAYIYDIIPVTHPEFCVPELVRDFTLSLCELGLLVDFIFTISDYTRKTVGALFAANRGRDIPMQTVPLAHMLTGEGGRATSWPRQLGKLKERPFVAYVSTVEGRKNHIYVVQAWQRLIDAGVDVPDLVFVGREGWRIGGLQDLLEGTNNLGGRVHLVHGLSDAELNSIYATCLFTVFSSFVEGWGLPVGESLVHGTPCVASSTASVPEVGGNLVDYLDPYNLRQGVEVLRRMIEDEAYREGRRRAIADSFVPRDWMDVGRDFVVKARAAMERDYPTRPIHPRIDEGAQFFPASLTTVPIVLSDYVPGPMRLVLQQSFYEAERHGMWMRGATGEISFLTTLAEGDEVIVYLDLVAAPHASGRKVTVHLVTADATAAGSSRSCQLAVTQRNLVRVQGRLLADGLCTIVIEADGEVESYDAAEQRSFIVGVATIGYVRADNMALREDLVERFTFQTMADEGRMRAA